MKRVLCTAIIAALFLGTQATAQSPDGYLGAFQFFVRMGDTKVDPLTTRVPDVGKLDLTYMRTAMTWGEFEPEKGKFDWNNPQAQRIDAYIAAGFKVVPAIRAISGWAVKHPEARKGASAPKDMAASPDTTYGYSESYYNFIKKVAEHYKGKFDYVAIENEMHAEAFWSGTMDEYLHLLSTARKAFRDVDPGVKIADGGIQGGALVWMIMQGYHRMGKDGEAARLFKLFKPEENLPRRFGAMMSRRAVNESQRNALYLLEHGMCDLVDVLNFHYYPPAETLPEVVSYLRTFTGKPIMTNEIGSRFKGTGKDIEMGAADIPKKISILAAMGVKPIIWFSPPGETGINTGAFVDHNQNIIGPTMKSFTTTARLLNKPIISSKNLSQGGLSRYSFSFGTGKVDVAWSDSAGAQIDRPASCKAYDLTGGPIDSGRIPLSQFPIFLECSP